VNNGNFPILGVVTFQKFPKVPVENFVRKHPVTMLRFPQKIKKNGAANKWGNIAGVLGDFLRGIEVGDPNGGWGGGKTCEEKRLVEPGPTRLV